ncbi:MAG TPA: amino acid ABC transporter permease [Solirubrobacteraceae bacterium]|nr:amino acid ABC transporter permease [Solirubrobacteraceae bacterium]
MSADASVLYDVPGPRAIRRQRVAGGIGALGVAVVLGLVVQKLAAEGQFDADTWEFLTVEGTWRAIWEGLRNTLRVAAVAIALALVFGAVFAVARLSERRVVRWPAIAVIEFFRAVPLLLLILFVFLGFADEIGRFWSLTLALMLYNGSVLAEIFRAGILSVPRGQSEAAYALGMTKTQVMRVVLVPQAVRIMLPAIISQSVVALKDTALGSIIAYDELARVGRQLYVFYNNPLAVGLTIAAIYIVINYTLSKLAVILEARQRRVRPTAGAEGRGGPADVVTEA